MSELELSSLCSFGASCFLARLSSEDLTLFCVPDVAFFRSLRGFLRRFLSPFGAAESGATAPSPVLVLGAALAGARARRGRRKSRLWRVAGRRPSSLGERCLHGVQKRVGLNPCLIEILRLPEPSHGDVEHQPSTLRDLAHTGTEMEHGSSGPS